MQGERGAGLGRGASAGPREAGRGGAEDAGPRGGGAAGRSSGRRVDRPAGGDPARRARPRSLACGFGSRELRAPCRCGGAGMRAPALLPPALLTCCGWLLGPVSAPPAPTARRPELPLGLGRCVCPPPPLSPTCWKRDPVSPRRSSPGAWPARPLLRGDRAAATGAGPHFRGSWSRLCLCFSLHLLVPTVGFVLVSEGDAMWPKKVSCWKHSALVFLNQCLRAAEETVH